MSFSFLQKKLSMRTFHKGQGRTPVFLCEPLQCYIFCSPSLLAPPPSLDTSLSLVCQFLSLSHVFLRAQSGLPILFCCTAHRCGWMKAVTLEFPVTFSVLLPARVYFLSPPGKASRCLSHVSCSGWLSLSRSVTAGHCSLGGESRGPAGNTPSHLFIPPPPSPPGFLHRRIPLATNSVYLNPT